MICGPGCDLSWRIFHAHLSRKCILLLSGGEFYRYQLSLKGLCFLFDFLSGWSFHCCKWGVKALSCYCVTVDFSFYLFYFYLFLFWFYLFLFWFILFILFLFILFLFISLLILFLFWFILFILFLFISLLISLFYCWFLFFSTANCLLAVALYIVLFLYWVRIYIYNCYFFFLYWSFNHYAVSFLISCDLYFEIYFVWYEYCYSYFSMGSICM